MRRMTRMTSTAITLILAVACGSGDERSYDTPLATAQGQASFYSDRFEGRRTASGATFSHDELVAAHRRYPFGTLLRVTNRNNDRSVRVTVVDRGPYAAPSTIIDLSRSAATQIGLDAAQGRVPVTVEVLEWGKGRAGS